MGGKEFLLLEARRKGSTGCQERQPARGLQGLKESAALVQTGRDTAQRPQSGEGKRGDNVLSSHLCSTHKELCTRLCPEGVKNLKVLNLKGLQIRETFCLYIKQTTDKQISTWSIVCTCTRIFNTSISIYVCMLRYGS